MSPAPKPDITRWSRIAQTWLEKVTVALHLRAENAMSAETRWAVGFYSAELLEFVLDDALVLAELLNEENLDDLGRKAAQLSARIRERRLAVKLSQVEGRTPDEAALFLARAEELRSR